MRFVHFSFAAVVLVSGVILPIEASTGREPDIDAMVTGSIPPVVVFEKSEIILPGMVSLIRRHERLVVPKTL